MHNEIKNKALTAADLLKKYNLKISSAESCTGGMFASYLTDISGISAIFELSVVSYSNRIKNKILNVKKQTLAEYGAVSRQTACEMASSIRAISGSDIGIAVTGVAGPSISEGKAVGTVYIALADKKSVIIEKLHIEPISRNYVREGAVLSMFELILKYLSKNNYS